MQNMTIPGLVGGIAILAIMVIIIILNFVSKNNKERARQFLEGLTDKLTETAIDIIKSFNPEDYDSIEIFETEVLNKVYDVLWDYILKEIENGAEYGEITKAIAKKITKEFVIEFVDKLFSKTEITDVISTAYNKDDVVTPEAVEEEDRSLLEVFSKAEYAEDVDKSDLPSGESELSEEEKEEIANLNPQSDEEKDINIEDDSVEYEDNPKEVNTKIVKEFDKNGKAMYFEIMEDGKKSRVTKEYAARFLSEDEL